MKIFLLGFMGSGKSYWGAQLSAALKLSFFDLDEVIIKGENKAIPAIFREYGETHFRQLENRYLKELSQKEDILISCGGGTPCYSDNMAFMNDTGLTVWLDIPVEVMVNRLKADRNERPLLKGLNEDELTGYVEQKLEERRFFYKQAQLIINPLKYNLNTLSEKIKSCTKPI